MNLQYDCTKSLANGIEHWHCKRWF